MYILLFILLLSIVGCSSINKQVTSSAIALTQEEENDLQTIAYQTLEESEQNEIIDREQAIISGFKSGSEFVVFNKKNSEKTDVKDTQTILVTFSTKEESTYESINVYLDEKGEKVLGFRTEDK